MAESASSATADARSSLASSSEEAGHDRDNNNHHHNTASSAAAAQLLPSRGISLNLASTSTSHGRPAAVKHM